MALRWILIALALVLTASPATVAKAFGKQVRYAGIHPIRKSDGGGICYIEGPHVHIYAANKIEYRKHGDDHVFVGDPVAYGWDGPKHAYKGPHPVHLDVIVGADHDVEYCYLDGPHYHSFQPPESPDFEVAGDAYFYVGTPPRAFIEARPTYVGINAVYRPIVYTRPVIEVEAPVGWVGARAEFVGHGGFVGGRSTFVAPRPGVYVETQVHVPAPPTVHFGIQVGGPSVIVHEHPGVIVHEHPGAIIVPHGKFKQHGHAHGKFKARW
jgi:hypothetical protein